MKRRTYDRAMREQMVKPEYLTNAIDRKLLSDIEALEASVADMRDQGRKPEQIDAFIEDRLFEVQSAHWKAHDLERQRYEGELRDLGNQWRRQNDADPTRALLERERARDRFRLAGDDELIVAANEYVNAAGEDLVRSPDELEVLAIEMTSREPTEQMSAVLRDRMVANRYREPWRHTERGDEITSRIEEHTVEYGTVNVSLDGRSLMTIDIPDVVKTE